MPPAEAQPAAIAVFAKAPVPGAVKTRLIPALGAERAARLQAAMIRRVVTAAVESGLGPVSLWCWPHTAHLLFQDLHTRLGVELWSQCEGDLGQRMLHCFSSLCRAGPVLLVGSDCPALDGRALRRASDSLRAGADAVFLPAEDGGYVLAGLRHAEPRLFESLQWGGPNVMAATRERLERLAWRWAEPLRLWDVDRPEDVERLRVSGLMSEWFLENGA